MERVKPSEGADLFSIPVAMTTVFFFSCKAIFWHILYKISAREGESPSGPFSTSGRGVLFLCLS
jgi:hypothetical protein